MKNIYVIVFLLFYVNNYSQNPCPETPTVDYGGKTYNTVQIGDQCWLRENLDIGTRINDNVGQTKNSIIEKYCYNNDEAKCTTDGGLYQWAEMVQYKNDATNATSTSPAFTGNVQGICPSGWHIPTLAEFYSLQEAVNNDGNKLKREDQGAYSGMGTNTSGFSAVFAGYRGLFGNFFSLGSFPYIWSSTETSARNATLLSLGYYDSSINFLNTEKGSGLSVRCLKDNFTDVGNNTANPYSFILAQNYPNPFNPSTTIKYSIPSSNVVTLKVFDVLGNEVTTLINGFQNIGSYEVNFDASKLSSGTYFYQLKAGEFSDTKKLLLLK